MFMANNINSEMNYRQFNNGFLPNYALMYHAGMSAIAENLLVIMKELGLEGPYDVARITKVSQPTIHRILTNPDYNASTNTIKKLVSGLKVSEARLRGIHTDDNLASDTSASITNTESNAIDTDLINIMAAMTTEQRNQLKAFGQFLVSTGKQETIQTYGHGTPRKAKKVDPPQVITWSYSTKSEPLPSIFPQQSHKPKTKKKKEQ